MSLPRSKVAFVGRDELAREQAAAYFGASGFLPLQADDADGLFRMLAETACELAIVQLELPDIDEFTLVKELKSRDVRCIVVTDKDDVVDRVLALELGADDYLSRTVDRRELLARARVVLRRHGGNEARARGGETGRGEPIRVEVPPDGLKFERVQRRLLNADGRIIPLTTAEFNLLTSLADNTNVPLTRERLYELVYNRRWSVYDRTLDTLVAKLRRKVERNPQHPELIKTVHGTGYIFTGVAFVS